MVKLKQTLLVGTDQRQQADASDMIEGIGTLKHKVEAAPAPPSGTGSYLPPVSSYRQGRGGRAGAPGAVK